jgi:hypothetical protein
MNKRPHDQESAKNLVFEIYVSLEKRVPRKTNATAAEKAMPPSISKVLTDPFLTDSTSAPPSNAASMVSKKALIRRAFGKELPPGLREKRKPPQWRYRQVAIHLLDHQ